MMTVVGIVLAGGLSRRMKGPDKVLLDLGGRTLLGRVIDRFGPQCAGLVLSANRASSGFEDYGLPVVPDEAVATGVTPETRAGPLAGILACLDWIADTVPGMTEAVSCAADTPFVPRDLVERLRAAAARHGTACACAVSGGRRHPVAALWPVAGRHALRHALADHRRGLSAMLDGLGCAEAEWPAVPVDPFLNINTPEDLDLARRVAMP